MSYYQYFLSIIAIICALTSYTKADITENSKVIGISGGEKHTLILTQNGIPSGCGLNGDSQLGIGYSSTSSQPWFIPVLDGDMNTSSGLLEGIISVKAGWRHSLALDTNRCVWAWGNNYYGEIGNGTKWNSYSSPVKVHGPNDSNSLNGIICIAAGRSGEFSLATDIGGNAWGWGRNDNGQIGIGSNSQDTITYPNIVRAGEQDPNNPNNPLQYISGISAGESHSVAVDFNGFVYAWGQNKFLKGTGYGRLGNGTTHNLEILPIEVNAGEQNPSNPSSPLKNIIAVAAGWEHTLALEKLNQSDPNCKGRVYAWGNNNFNDLDGGGQLGDGTTINRDRPVIVHAGDQNSNPDSDLEGIIAVSAGDGHSIALDQYGFVWAWGGNYFGQLGNGDNNNPSEGKSKPVKVLRFDGFPLSGITTISAGYWYNLAVDVNGILCQRIQPFNLSWH